MLKFFVIIILSITPFLGYGQGAFDTNGYTYSIGGYASRGFIVMHDKEMGHLTQSHTNGASVYIKKHTYGKRAWEEAFKYPDIGISLHYLDYNSHLLGETFSAMGTIDYYLLRKKNRAVIFEFGFGLGYNNKPYNSETNNKNIALGSYITYAALLRLGYSHQIVPGLHIDSGIKLSHFSNGAFKMPNKGINVVSADLGVSYDLYKVAPDYIIDTEPVQIDRKTRYNFSLGSGIKEIDPIGSDKFSFFIFSMYASKRTTKSNEFNLGVDAFYSFATKEEIKIDKDLNGASPDFKRVGVFAGHSLLMGKLSFLLQLGVYVYKPYKSDKPVYQRYGFKYAFHKNVFGGIFLKTHYGKADAVEWTVGFKL